MSLIKFLKGTEASYNALENKNNNTFYVTEDNLYLGERKINSGDSEITIDTSIKQNSMNPVTNDAIAKQFQTMQNSMDDKYLNANTGGTVSNIFKVNKTSSTNPTGLIELDIHNDGKVAFLTSNNGDIHDSLVHLDGIKNNGTVTLNGKVIDISAPTIGVKNNPTIIDIYKTLIIAKYGTSYSYSLNQIVISDGNEIGFNSIGVAADKNNSLLHLLGGPSDGITTLRGNAFNIYPEEIILGPNTGTTDIVTKNLNIHHMGASEGDGPYRPQSYVHMQDNLINIGVTYGDGDDKFKASFHNFEFGFTSGIEPGTLLEMKGTGNGREIKMHGGAVNAYVRNGGFQLVPLGSNILYELDSMTGGLGSSQNPWRVLYLKNRGYNEKDGYDYQTTISNDMYGLHIITWNEDSGDDYVGICSIKGEEIRIGEINEPNFFNRISSNGMNKNYGPLLIHTSNYYTSQVIFGINIYPISEVSFGVIPYINVSTGVTANLGYSNNKWTNIYATNGTIQTSDRNEKNTIEELTDEKAQTLIYGLKPSTYKMNGGTSGRTHWGMISQDIEELLEDLGWTSEDFAGFIKSPKEITITEDENGNPLKEPTTQIVEGEYNYSLRYDEFISPMIKVIQSQHEEIDKLKIELLDSKSEIEYLKTQLNYIIENIQGGK